MTLSLLDRLADRFAVDDGCWEWTAGHMKGGYGIVRVDGRQCLAHRVIYELLVGPIPEGKELDHLCRNTGCVRPSHLEPVKHRENVLRGEGLAARQAKQTHCGKGHLLSGSNLRMQGRKRVCRRCNMESCSRWRLAQKGG